MIIVIDNFDSFTYNLVQYLYRFEPDVQVFRNNEVTLDQVLELKPKGILMSPGPCTPSEAGVCLDIASAALQDQIQGVPVLGVCLGHQTIGQQSGAHVERAFTIRHGKTSPIKHVSKGVFQGLPSPFNATRYHSLVIREESISPEFEVTAIAEDDGLVMGILHKNLRIEGVQFHPESILTEHGHELMGNWVQSLDSTH